MARYSTDANYKLYLASVDIVILYTFREFPTKLVSVPPHDLPWRKENRTLSVCYINDSGS